MSATWLCTFTVLVDLPSDMAIADMEGFIALAVAHAANDHGFPGNASAQLVATAGNVSVLDPQTQVPPTPGVDVPPPVVASATWRAPVTPGPVQALPSKLPKGAKS